MKLVSFSFLVLFLFPVRLVSQGFIVAVGGGTEYNNSGSWSEKPYKWFAEHVRNDTMVVLSYNSTDSWIPNYFKSFGVKEVINLTITGNSLSEIVEALKKSSGAFLKGGDQEDYVDAWKGTEVITELNRIYKEGGVLGGTSAGAMILGEFASIGGPLSYENLENPYNKYNTYEINFLDALKGIVFDTHYFQRARFGRLLGMMARMQTDTSKELLGIGIDDQTAVTIDSLLQLQVLGSGGVHILIGDIQAKQSSQLSGTDIIIHQLVDGFGFDLIQKELTTIPDRAKKIPVSKSENGFGRIEIRPNLFTVSTFQQIGGEESIENWIIIGSKSSYSELTALSTSISVFQIDSLQFLHESNNLIHSNRIFIDGTTDQIRTLVDSSKKYDNVLGLGNSIGPILVLDMNKINDLHSLSIKNLNSSKNASYNGEFLFSQGADVTKGTITDRVFSDTDYFENRVTASPSILNKKEQASWMLLSTGASHLRFDKNTIQYSSDWSRSGSRSTPALLIEFEDSVYTAQSPFSFSRENRHAVALTNGKLSIIPSGIPFNSSITTSIEKVENESSSKQIDLIKAFPNPFNPSTKLSFELSQSEEISIQVFDVLGRIAFSKNEFRSKGNQEFQLTLNGIATGVYLVRIQSSNTVYQTKITLIK